MSIWRYRLDRGVLVAVALLAAGAPGCDAGSKEPMLDGFRVTLLGDAADRGTPDEPLDFSVDRRDVRIKIEALRGGKVDASYGGWVVVDVQPTGKLTRNDPLAIKLEGGVADSVDVAFKMAYGAVRLVVTEQGHAPRISDPVHARCNNGKDDDGDGYVDYPNDRGCFHLSDDDEGGGTGAAGASEPIYFANPRIGDVQAPYGLGTGGDESALRGLRVVVDRGFMVVTRVGVDGLYVTDFDGVRWDAAQTRFVIDPVALSYRSVFAFNFSTPLNLQEGDCLVELAGTVEEFYGYTELGKPTWKKGDAVFCGAKAHEASEGALEICALPRQGEDAAALEQRQKACRLELEALANTPFDVTRMVVDDGGQQRSVWDQRYMQTERFEAALVQVSDVEISEVTVFSEIRECDRNDNGVIDYFDKEEADCADDCGEKEGCVVAETYRRFGQWTVTFIDGIGVTRELSIVTAGSIPDFDPVGAKGRRLSKIVGTLRHLAFGEPPWILEPRRPADCPDCKSD